MTDSERAAHLAQLRAVIPLVEADGRRQDQLRVGWDLLASIRHYTDGGPAFVFIGDVGLERLAALVASEYPASIPARPI